MTSYLHSAGDTCRRICPDGSRPDQDARVSHAANGTRVLHRGMKPVAAAALVALLCAVAISHAAAVRAGGHVVLQTAQATSVPLIPSPSDIEKMSLGDAVEAISAMTKEQAVHVFNEMSTGKVVAMMGEMDLGEASDIWGGHGARKGGCGYGRRPR